MAIPKILKSAEGNWKGKSRLHCPWPPEAEPIRECESSLAIALDPNGTHARLSLIWNEDGAQFSEFLVCGSSDSDKVTCGWTDSWHMSSAVMLLTGTGMEGSLVNLLGAYQVEGHPDWGWRITFESPTDSELVLKMYNIEPEGNEEWAVEAVYQRA